MTVSAVVSLVAPVITDIKITADRKNAVKMIIFTVLFDFTIFPPNSLKSRKGVLPKAGESDEVYKSILTEDVVKAQGLLENATGKKPTCFVYPFGAKNDLTEKLIKEMGFSCTLTCTEKPNIITKNPDSLYELGRYRRDRNESMQNLLIRIEMQS